MELTIYTYGYAYYIFNTLNAIAMLRQTSLFTAVIEVMTLGVGVYYACKMAASQAEGEWRRYIIKILGTVALIQILLLPTTSMNVKDHVEKTFWRVDNIPLAFALPIGIVESLGHVVTMGFEQAFSVVGSRSSFNYYNYGTVFGARLAKEVMQVRVRDPEYVANMNNFIKRCVVLPAMIGHQFTKEELVATRDMWGLVSSRAGTFTRVPMIINGIKQDPHPTCREAVPYFEKIMSLSGKTDITEISIKLRAAGEGSNYNPNHDKLNKALTEQISTLYNNETSIENILKHNMMINSLNQYRAGKYPAVKAMLNHEAGGFLSGDLGEKILTSMLSICKNLVYSSFLFVFPLMLLAGGISRYGSWITVCLSLQMWPPLYSVLNMMIDIAYDPVHIVSYSAWATEMRRMDSIASIASGLVLSIPMLAIYITRMGEGGFMQVARSIISSAQSSGSAAAAEQASGGRQYDNESISNRSYGNVNENKYDDARQYVTGTNSGIRSDGSIEKVLPNGKVITTGGAGATSSVGEARYTENEGVSTALHEGRNRSVQAMHSTQSALNNAQESLVSKEASALRTIAENARTDNGYNIDTSTDEGREVLTALNKIDSLSKDNKYSWQQHAEAYLKTDVTPPIAGKIASFLGFSASGGGVLNASNSSDQSDSSLSQISNDLNTNERNSVNKRTNNNAAYLESLGLDKSQQESIRESYNETQRLERSVSAHKDNIDAYNKALDYTHTHGSEFSKDVTQDVIDAYRDQYGVSDAGAADSVLNGSHRAKEVFNNLSRVKANEVLSQVRATGRKIESSDIVGDFAERQKDIINTNPSGEGGAVASFAEQNNMKGKGEANEEINAERNRLQNKHSDKFFNNIEKIEHAKTYNENLQADRQDQINKHEENRIGSGWVGTLGRTINGVGRPPEGQPMPEFEPIMNYYGKPEKIPSIDNYQNAEPMRINQNKQEFDKNEAVKTLNEFKPNDKEK